LKKKLVQIENSLKLKSWELKNQKVIIW